MMRTMIVVTVLLAAAGQSAQSQQTAESLRAGFRVDSRVSAEQSLIRASAQLNVPKQETHGFAFCRGRWGKAKCITLGGVLGFAAGAWIGQLATPQSVIHTDTNNCAYGLYGPYCTVECVAHCDVTFTRTWVGGAFGGILGAGGGYYVAKLSNR